MTGTGGTKFTPGPWHPGHLGDPETTCECRSVVDEGHAGGIATISMDNGIKSIADGGNDAPSREEAIGNMHLIASAPDLYAALLDAVEQLEFWGGDTTQANVILARSRGETQAKPST